MGQTKKRNYDRYTLDFKLQAVRMANHPDVMSKAIAESLGIHRLMAAILYGSGLRKIELIRLRVQDIDRSLLQVRVWNGKGFKHRITTLAPELLPAIGRQIKQVQILLEEDIETDGYAGV